MVHEKKILFTILESYQNRIQKKGFLYISISIINKLLKYPDLTAQYIYYPLKLASRWPQGGFLKGPNIKLMFPWIYSKFWIRSPIVIIRLLLMACLDPVPNAGPIY